MIYGANSFVIIEFVLLLNTITFYTDIQNNRYDGASNILIIFNKMVFQNKLH